MTCAVSCRMGVCVEFVEDLLAKATNESLVVEYLSLFESLGVGVEASA